MKKFTSSLFLITAMVLIIGCGRNNYPESPGSGNITTKHPNAIPYTLAHNYFVLNSVQSGTTISKRIDTQAEFNRYFGVATTMSTTATPIDFNNQYVIALIVPETNQSTTLSVANLTSYNGIVTLSYNQTVGPAQSFHIRPSLVVIVDRKYSGDVLVVEK